MESSGWNREIVMVVQPLLDARSLNGGVQETQAETGLFAAVHCKSPVLM